MEQIREELVSLFEDMLAQLGSFKKKTYAGAFEKGLQEHKKVVADIEELCSHCDTEEECLRAREEIARAIPEHAKERMEKVRKFQRNQKSTEYNLNMVVYVMPILNYTKSENCEKISMRMVEVWNELGFSSLPLRHSPSYEQIAGSFGRGFLGLFMKK